MSGAEMRLRNWMRALARKRTSAAHAELHLDAALAAARAEGYAAARRQAVAVATEAGKHWCDPYTRCTCDWQSRLGGLADDIRAMTDREASPEIDKPAQ